MRAPRPRIRPLPLWAAAPADLSCAYYLALMGQGPFWRGQAAGRDVASASPATSFPWHLLDAEIASILSLGIEVHTGVTVGRISGWRTCKSSMTACILPSVPTRIKRPAFPGGQ